MNFNGKNVLVTGGAGFIGSHLVDALVKANANVQVIDTLKSGCIENLDHSIDHIQFFEVDIRDYESIVRSTKHQDLIFHLAANASVPNSVSDYSYDFETNVVGTYNILRAAIKNGVSKVIYTSSAAVYGKPNYVPTKESHPLNPISPYGATTASGETIGFVYGETFGLDFSSIRIYNNYGPRQVRFVMYDLLEKLRNDPTRLIVLGDGRQVRDYCYVSDAVRAFLLIASTSQSRGHAYNLAGGDPITIRDLAYKIIDLLNLSDIQVEYSGESWKGDIQTLCADITKIRKLGFEPQVNLQDGLTHLVEWFEKSKS